MKNIKVGSIYRRIEAVLNSKKNHLCDFCGDAITVGHTYFRMVKLRKIAEAPFEMKNGKTCNGFVPIDGNREKKCCYTCFPFRKKEFLDRDKENYENTLFPIEDKD